VVFSDGPETADIMIVGEGPGAKEDALGIPFSGPAGQLLTKALAFAGIGRQDCYWTNAVRCWPQVQGKSRTPKKIELDTCLPLLMEEIRQIKPKVILLVGNTAAKTLLKHEGALGPSVGTWATINGIPTLTTWHPAAILHTSSHDENLSQQYKRDLWRDIKALRDVRNNLIKGRQAGISIGVESPLSFNEQLEIIQ
jgi:DNA polymerase